MMLKSEDHDLLSAFYTFTFNFNMLSSYYVNV